MQESMRETHFRMQESLTRMQERNTRTQESRLSTLAANALIDLATLVAKTYNSEHSTDPSPTRLHQLAANATDSQLAALRIPQKCWAVLRKLDQVLRSLSFSSTY